jgi:hypothetical protein
MKSFTNIRFFPLIILVVNILFLGAMFLLPEAYFLQTTLYLQMNFGLFAFSLLLIMIWGGVQWHEWMKNERNLILPNEEDSISNPYIRRSENLNQSDSKTIGQSGHTVQAYLSLNGWSASVNDDILS